MPMSCEKATVCRCALQSWIPKSIGLAFGLILGLRAETSPNIINAAGLQIEANISRPALIEAVVKAVPPFRDRMVRLAREKDLKSVLTESEVKKDVLLRLKTIFGSDKSLLELSKAYERLMGTVDQRTIEMCAFKNVFLYDGPELKRRMRAGERLPFFRYDQASDTCTYDWTVERAAREGAQAALPIVIVVTNPTESDEALVARMLVFYEENLRRTLAANYGLPGYHVIRGIASELVTERASNCPPWFRAGLVGAVTIKVLGDLIGTKNAIGTYVLTHETAGGTARIAPGAVLTWNPEAHNPVENIAYSRVATDVMLKVTNVHGFQWIPFACARLQSQPKPTSQDIFAVVKELSGADLEKIASAD